MSHQHHNFLSVIFLGSAVVIFVVAIVASGSLLSRSRLDGYNRASAPELKQLNPAREIGEETLEGELQMSVLEDFDKGVSEVKYFIVNEVDGRIEKTEFDYKGNKELKPNSKVKIKGKRNQLNKIEVDERMNSGSIEEISPDVLGTYTHTGSKKAAVILFTFQGRALPTSPTVGQVWGMFNGATNSVKTFMKENSYGAFTIENSQVFGWYTLPQAHSCAIFDYAEDYINGTIIDQNVNFAAFDQVVFIIDAETSCHGGVGSPGSIGFRTQDGSMVMPVAKINKNKNYNLMSIVHEIGHNLVENPHHANELDCGSVSYKPSGCTSRDYGDKTDSLGLPAYAYHYSVNQKSRIGWMPASRVKTVTAAGDYFIQPLEKVPPSGGFLAVRVGSFTIENREKVGHDSNLPTSASTNAALIKIGWDMLDGTPNTAGTADGGFPLGQEFNTGVNGIRITPLSKTNGVLKVRIAMNAPPTPTPTGIPTRTPTPTRTGSPTRTPTPKPAGVENLVNPGFDSDANADNRPDGWIIHNSFIRSAATGTIRSGTASGRHYSSVNGSYVVSQVVSVVPGASYTFSGYANVPATTDDFALNFELYWRNSAGTLLRGDGVGSYSKGTPAGWVRAISTKVAPAGASTAAVRMNVQRLNGSVYVDDFSFKRN